MVPIAISKLLGNMVTVSVAVQVVDGRGLFEVGGK